MEHFNFVSVKYSERVSVRSSINFMLLCHFGVWRLLNGSGNFSLFRFLKLWLFLKCGANNFLGSNSFLSDRQMGSWTATVWNADTLINIQTITSAGCWSVKRHCKQIVPESYSMLQDSEMETHAEEREKLRRVANYSGVRENASAQLATCSRPKWKRVCSNSRTIAYWI